MDLSGIDLGELDSKVATNVFNLKLTNGMINTFQGMCSCPLYSSNQSSANEVIEEMNKKDDEALKLFMQNLAIFRSLSEKDPTPAEICFSAIKALAGETI